MRLLLALPGLGLLGGGIFLMARDSMAAGIFVSLLGAFLALAGIVGWRRPLEGCLEGLGEALGNGMIETILRALLD
jgi:hypothetical protein